MNRIRHEYVEFSIIANSCTNLHLLRDVRESHGEAIMDVLDGHVGEGDDVSSEAPLLHVRVRPTGFHHKDVPASSPETQQLLLHDAQRQETLRDGARIHPHQRRHWDLFIPQVPKTCFTDVDDGLPVLIHAWGS